MHAQLIIRAYRQACALAVAKVKDMAISIEGKDEQDKLELLRRCASTTLNSKLVAGEKEFFSKMVVDAIHALDPETLDPRLIGVKKVQGGAMRDSFLVDGVAFKKTFSYAGFEQQPKSFTDPKILVLNIELELKARERAKKKRFLKN